MGLLYSTYEAKARFSEILRQVREGKIVTVSYRGEPVAEIRSIAPDRETLDQRLDDLTRRGIIVPSGQPRERLRELERRSGALRRFLEDRNA